jgi:hypothetical protein
MTEIATLFKEAFSPFSLFALLLAAFAIWWKYRREPKPTTTPTNPPGKPNNLNNNY